MNHGLFMVFDLRDFTVERSIKMKVIQDWLIIARDYVTEDNISFIVKMKHERYLNLRDTKEGRR